MGLEVTKPGSGVREEAASDTGELAHFPHSSALDFLRVSGRCLAALPGVDSPVLQVTKTL